MKNTYVIGILLIVFTVGGFFGGGYLGGMLGLHRHYNGMHVSSMHHLVSESRIEYIAMRDSITGEMREHGDYACCLKKPCTYCIEKTPGHGEGAACHCLDDTMNGVHPCGECIGEILEGHGNPLIAEYFATAIAEEVGEQHLATLKQIISDKYKIAVADQI